MRCGTRSSARVGATAVVGKPFTIKELSRTVTRLLRGAAEHSRPRLGPRALLDARYGVYSSLGVLPAPAAKRKARPFSTIRAAAWGVATAGTGARVFQVLVTGSYA
jgi:DNA-binding response OmpR family regulator